MLTSCKDLSSEQAYIFGLLHDIGRYAGVSSERHLIDGYRYCMERGWEKAAQICISHAFMIQDIATSIGEFDVSDEDYLFMKEFVANAVYDDYDRLVQLCDALAMPTGFCLFPPVYCRCVNTVPYCHVYKSLFQKTEPRRHSQCIT